MPDPNVTGIGKFQQIAENLAGPQLPIPIRSIPNLGGFTPGGFPFPDIFGLLPQFPNPDVPVGPSIPQIPTAPTPFTPIGPQGPNIPISSPMDPNFTPLLPGPGFPRGNDFLSSLQLQGLLSDPNQLQQLIGAL